MLVERQAAVVDVIEDAEFHAREHSESQRKALSGPIDDESASDRPRRSMQDERNLMEERLRAAILWHGVTFEIEPAACAKELDGVRTRKLEQPLSPLLTRRRNMGAGANQWIDHLDEIGRSAINA